MRTFEVGDLFCGAGGSSSGAARAIRAMGAKIDLVAVNHWDTAIATHSRNHPTARHVCVDLDAARPEVIVPKGHLDLLMASPECVFFSRARGGKPVSDQRRMSAWHVQRWCSALDITCVLVENVPEFRDWGPLLPTGRPDPTKKGTYFEAWIKSLWMMGYEVDWKLINAADYGDATTRVRFFLQARKDGRPIRWPTASHTPSGKTELFGGQKRWRAARDVIDWSVPGRSILGRRKPLSEKTRRRIARGLTKFGGNLAPLYIRLLDLPDDVPGNGAMVAPQPFTLANRGSAAARSVDGPMATVTTLRSWNVGVVEPTIEPFMTVCRENNVPKSIDEPLGTITTEPAMFLVEPTLEPFVIANRNHATPKSTDEPLPTATTSTGGGIGLCEATAEPFVLGQQGGGVARSVHNPLPTVTADGYIRVIEPSLVPYYGAAETTRSIDAPLPTLTAKQRYAVCSPMAVPYGPRSEARSVEDPLPTILTKDRLGLATPMIVPFYGPKNGQARMPRSADEPLATVTTEPRFGVCEPTADPVPFVLSRFGEYDETSTPRVLDIEKPLPTVTASGAGYLVEPFIGTARWDNPSDSVDEPLRTITGQREMCIVEPFLVPQFGERDGQAPRVHDVAEPLPAVTSHGAGALVSPTIESADGRIDPRRLVLINDVPHLLDIRFRMLNNGELARAMGFDDEQGQYQFSGTVEEVTRQIGNAVAVNTAAALVTAILGEGE